MAGVHRALGDLDKSIPEDVALITLGDSQLAKHINPSMTTLDLHTEKLGYLAAKKLTNLINGEESTPDREIVQANFIKRRSCGCNIAGGDKENKVEKNVR